jgi:hypothetical protein
MIERSGKGRQLHEFFKNQLQLLAYKTCGQATRFDPVTMRTSLAICARSPKTYEYLSRLLMLPSTRTLRSVFKAYQHGPGISQHVFEYVVEEIRRNKLDTILCPRTGCLIFDEV